MTESRVSKSAGRRGARSGVVFAAAMVTAALAAAAVFAACSSAQSPPSSTTRAGAPAAGRSSPASTGRTKVEVKEGVVASLRPDKPGTLAPGQAASVQGGFTVVGFERVIEDSRCPRGTTCVWAGRARVELTLRQSPSGPDRLMEVEVGSPGKGSIDVGGGLKVVAEALEPYPEAKIPTSAADYRLRLALAKSDGEPKR